MPIRSVDLPDALDRFIDASVEAGAFTDPGEVMREGLRLLQSQQEYAAKVEALHAAVAIGEADLTRGDVIDVDLDELEDFLANLETRETPRIIGA